MKRKNTLRRMMWFFILTIAICVATVIGCQMAVLNAAENRMYDDVSEIPHRKVALLLGTSPIGRSGLPNQFFLRRIDATVKLYKAGKFDRLIISGANRPEEFNEPEEMKAALVTHNVPDSIMTLDGKGFRTINSILWAKDVYGADSLMIISQQFHNERALFLTKCKGIEAVAFNAENTSSQRWRFLMFIRESLARVKAVFEVLFV